MTTRIAVGSWPSSFEHSFATFARARGADRSERAHSTHLAWPAAVTARPQAIVPEPAIPSRSFIRAGTSTESFTRTGVWSRAHGAEGREVVIVEAARTPIGRGHLEKGYYKDTHPNELLGAATAR